MKKIIFISVHPIHYNDYLFHEIDKAGIDIQVYYTQKVLSNYPWKDKLNYSFKNANCNYKGGVDWALLLKAAFSSNTVFIIAGWDTMFKNLLLLVLMLTGKKYILWTDTIKNHVQRSSLKKTLRNFWVQRILSGAFKIFTTGLIGVKAMKEIYTRNDDKIINFPFATDLGFFNTTAQFDLFASHKIIISSGRLLNSHKGYDLGIKALGKLKEAGCHFTYYLAGTGPDKEMLEALIAQNNLTENVHMLGWQEIGGIKDLYTKGHIFLHPSHFDPFPNAVLEAMASGLLVVASDKAGSAVERIHPGKSGYIFADDQLDQLTETLIQVAALLPQEAQAISHEAQAVAKKWDVSYHLNIIQQVVK